jgi:hypothetical protein
MVLLFGEGVVDISGVHSGKWLFARVVGFAWGTVDSLKAWLMGVRVLLFEE